MFSSVQSISAASKTVFPSDGTRSREFSSTRDDGVELKQMLMNGDNTVAAPFEQNEKASDKTKTPKAHELKTLDFSRISDKIKNLINEPNLSIQFSMDKDSKKIIMKIINTETNETVRQFPQETALKIAKMVDNLEAGQVTNATV